MTEFTAVTNWDDAYANRAHAPGADVLIDRWPRAAAEFRLAHDPALDLPYVCPVGAVERHVFDLFQPAPPAKGLMVFVHGGYWMSFDKNSWSHYAAGALAEGMAVAIPSYTLAPTIRVRDIKQEIIAAVVTAAERVEGPIVLVGHSAGGHLVTRLACADCELPGDVRARLDHIVSISGVHDLRPLLRTGLNDTLQLDSVEAAGESPALLSPRPGTRLTCLVGALERPEFIRQSALLANSWIGLGATTRLEIRADCHHFNIIDGLMEADPAVFDSAGQ